MTKTKPKGFCWPPDLFDLYEAKAAQMRAANPKSRESVSSLQEKALYAYAEAQGWLIENKPPDTEKPLN